MAASTHHQRTRYVPISPVMRDVATTPSAQTATTSTVNRPALAAPCRKAMTPAATVTASRHHRRQCRAGEHAERAELVAGQPCTGRAELGAHDPPCQPPSSLGLGRVAEELEDRRQVPVVGEQLLEDRRQPQHRGGDDRRHDARPEAPAAVLSASGPPRHRPADHAGTEHERGVAHVGLDDEGPDADQPRQHRDVAVGQRPREQQVGEERQHGDPWVPRIDEQVRVVRQGQHEQHDGDEGGQRHAAPAPGDEQRTDDRRRVEQGGADEDTGRAEQPVERSEQPEQQRSGMVPAVARVGARQRRVAPAHVVDLQELEGQIGGRVPVPSDERHGRREHRRHGQRRRCRRTRPSSCRAH